MKTFSLVAVITIAMVSAASGSNLTRIYAAPTHELLRIATDAGTQGHKLQPADLGEIAVLREGGTLTSAETIQADTPDPSVTKQKNSQAAARSPGTDAGSGMVGSKAYEAHCSMCHGKQREGNPPAIPSLVGVGGRLDEQQITTIIHHGKGIMPPFPNVQHEELTALLHFLNSAEMPATQNASKQDTSTQNTSTQNTSVMEKMSLPLASGALGAGGSLFQQNCSFCHGRDAGGGESGPDLTRSKLVATDVAGDKISDVIRNGRPEKMPAFKFSDTEMTDIVVFIHDAAKKAASTKGGRRGVDVADLQTGNLIAGKEYFQGAGGCASCHSPTGDLAGIASRYEGLQLEERMLYPRDVKSHATVTLLSGEVVKGTVAYRDEFTLGITDASGTYRSWPVATVKYAVDSPVDAHVALFPKYTDDDIHNLMAYIQTLR